MSVKTQNNPNKVDFQPKGNSTISPYLCVKGAARAIEFYKKVFGATERFRMEEEGKVGHAELSIGDSIVMVADEYPDMEFRAPQPGSSQPIQLMVYVPDADLVAEKAEAHGAKIVQPVKDQFYGDRSGKIVDPFGHVWLVSTHVEDLTPAMLEKRFEEFKAQSVREKAGSV